MLLETWITTMFYLCFKTSLHLLQEGCIAVNLQKSFRDEDLHVTFHRLWGGQMMIEF